MNLLQAVVERVDRRLALRRRLPGQDAEKIPDDLPDEFARREHVVQRVGRPVEERLQPAGFLTLKHPVAELGDNPGDLIAQPLQERPGRLRQCPERGHQRLRDRITDRGDALPGTLSAGLQVVHELRRGDRRAQVFEEVVERVRVAAQGRLQARNPRLAQIRDRPVEALKKALLHIQPKILERRLQRLHRINKLLCRRRQLDDLLRDARGTAAHLLLRLGERVLGTFQTVGSRFDAVHR